MLNSDALKELVLSSIKARGEQGYDMAELREQAEGKEYDCDGWLELYNRIAAAPKKPGYAYEEPDTLAEIRALRPSGQRVMSYNLTALELKDKIRGALQGRICGVILGRPVEGWPGEQIEKYLEGAGCYPLDFYIPRNSAAEGEKPHPSRLRCTREYLGYVGYAEPDDDINYVFLALKLVEKLGINFTTLDVGYNWLENIMVNWLWGPERTAYLNLARYTEGERWPQIDDAKLWEIAHYLNDYSEQIGALIRGDVYGYICPGQPELAAELAYRDAMFTHVANGIYGELFASAMISAAFCTDDVREAINTGLSEIPANCRLAEAVRTTIGWHDAFGDWRKVSELIDEHYTKPYNDGHTINNAAIIVNALLAGKGDLEKTICVAVMQGQDTDCTAATAGSVVGAMAGAAVLPQKWTAPINDTVHTGVFGESNRSILGAADRIFHIANMVVKTQRKLPFRHAEPEV